MQETTTTYSILLDTFYFLILVLFLIGVFREVRHITGSK